MKCVSSANRQLPPGDALLMIRIYGMFAAALKDQFPDDPPEENLAKAINLYSALVGTLTMARTISDPALALTTLEAGKRYLRATFVPRV